MYSTPSMHLELAKQRHREILAEARRYNVPKEVGDVDGAERLLAAKGVFAGIFAALTSFTRPKPATESVASPC